MNAAGLDRFQRLFSITPCETVCMQLFQVSSEKVWKLYVDHGIPVQLESPGGTILNSCSVGLLRITFRPGSKSPDVFWKKIVISLTINRDFTFHVWTTDPYGNTRPLLLYVQFPEKSSNDDTNGNKDGGYGEAEKDAEQHPLDKYFEFDEHEAELLEQYLKKRRKEAEKDEDEGPAPKKSSNDKSDEDPEHEEENDNDAGPVPDKTCPHKRYYTWWRYAKELKHHLAVDPIFQIIILLYASFSLPIGMALCSKGQSKYWLLNMLLWFLLWSLGFISYARGWYVCRVTEESANDNDDDDEATGPCRLCRLYNEYQGLRFEFRAFCLCHVDPWVYTCAGVALKSIFVAFAALCCYALTKTILVGFNEGFQIFFLGMVPLSFMFMGLVVFIVVCQEIRGIQDDFKAWWGRRHQRRQWIRNQTKQRSSGKGD